MAGLLDLPDEILIKILLDISHCQIMEMARVHMRYESKSNYLNIIFFCLVSAMFYLRIFRDKTIDENIYPSVV